MKIVLIGAGNLAWHLASALKKSGHQILAVYSRTKSSAELLANRVKAIPVNKIEALPTDADLYIIALPDQAISPFLKSLKFIPNAIVHTSGSISISIFPKRFKNIGVLYPLQTFSKNNKVNLKYIPFLLESNNAMTKKIVVNIAKSISSKVHFINSEKRKKIHLAAVFSNNFVNYLYSLSAEILKENKLPFDLLKPLILETSRKILENTPEKMQTGPARRNDIETIHAHLRLLSGQKQMKTIYKLLSTGIIDKYKGK